MTTALLTQCQTLRRSIDPAVPMPMWNKESGLPRSALMPRWITPGGTWIASPAPVALAGRFSDSQAKHVTYDPFRRHMNVLRISQQNYRTQLKISMAPRTRDRQADHDQRQPTGSRQRNDPWHSGSVRGGVSERASHQPLQCIATGSVRCRDAAAGPADRIAVRKQCRRMRIDVRWPEPAEAVNLAAANARPQRRTSVWSSPTAARRTPRQGSRTGAWT